MLEWQIAFREIIKPKNAWRSCSQLGATLPPRGHMATLEDISGCTAWSLRMGMCATDI